MTISTETRAWADGSVEVLVKRDDGETIASMRVRDTADDDFRKDGLVYEVEVALRERRNDTFSPAETFSVKRGEARLNRRVGPEWPE